MTPNVKWTAYLTESIPSNKLYKNSVLCDNPISSVTWLNLVGPKKCTPYRRILNFPLLLGQVRGKIRLKHYSIRTEQAYLDWIKRFIRHFGKRHPRELGADEVATFLTHLAVAGKVAASTQNQAKSALLFLYREVLEVQLPWLDNVAQAKAPKRLPVVLTRIFSGYSETDHIYFRRKCKTYAESVHSPDSTFSAHINAVIVLASVISASRTASSASATLISITSRNSPSSRSWPT